MQFVVIGEFVLDPQWKMGKNNGTDHEEKKFGYSENEIG